MTGNQEIAKKYSQALFELAREQDQLLDFRDQLDEIWQLTEENDDLRKVLFHHRILPEDKKGIIEKVFKGSISDQVFNFLCLLIDKRREYFLASIVEEFNRLVNKAEEIVEVEVISAIELKQELKDTLKAKLDQLLDYNITLNESLDPEILGGLILKIGDYIIDGSLKKELGLIKERIEQIPVSELGV